MNEEAGVGSGFWCGWLMGGFDGSFGAMSGFVNLLGLCRDGLDLRGGGRDVCERRPKAACRTAGLRRNVLERLDEVKTEESLTEVGELERKLAKVLVGGVFQDTRDGLYLETSIGYVQKKCGYGYKAASKAWRNLREVVGWDEFDTAEATLMGMPLRKLRRGERYGRHLVFKHRDLDILKLLGEAESPESPEFDVTFSRNTKPYTIDLKRTPSPDRRTGGAQCQVCKDHHGDPLRFSVVYSGSQAHLYVRRSGPSSESLGLPSWNNGRQVRGRRFGGILVDSREKRNEPVGGNAIDASKIEKMAKTRNHICCILKNVLKNDGVRSKFRTIGHLNTKDPISILQRAEKLSFSEKNFERAMLCGWMTREALEFGEEVEDLLYTKMVSVSSMMVSGWTEVKSRSGKSLYLPDGWYPIAQSWVLFDLDNFDSIYDEDLKGALDKMENVIRTDSQLSGRLAVVQTSPTGLQVWCELAVPRENPRNWFANADTKAWYKSLGSRILRSARRSGLRKGLVGVTQTW